jgi:ATP-dependent Clp protease, protease subunit
LAENSRREARFLKIMTSRYVILLLVVLGALLQGCRIVPTFHQADGARAGTRIDFDDPLLNRRQVFLFGSIGQRAAEDTIQKLLFLNGENHEPIDLYLQTPGGDLKHAMAIEQTMRLIESPVNTHAFFECSSGGALLLAGGTGTRRAFQSSVIIIHGMKVIGRPPAGLFPRVQDEYTEFWRKRARLPEAWLPLPQGVIHVLSADEALEYGLVDEVIER